MIGKNEIDNGYFAIVGMYQIDLYRQSENVILDKKMNFYLNMAKASLKTVEKQYSKFIENNDKVARRTKKKLVEAIFEAAGQEGGEVVALMKEDEELISVLDSIAYKYSIALEKSKSIPKKVKTAMKKFISYWQGLEKYIVGGAR